MDYVNAAAIGAMQKAASSACLNQPKRTDFQTILDRVRQATKEARESAVHSGAVANIIHGSHDTECGADCARDSRIGLIGEFEDALDLLFEALGATRSNLRRISIGIPSDAPSPSLG